MPPILNDTDANLLITWLYGIIAFFEKLHNCIDAITIQQVTLWVQTLGTWFVLLAAATGIIMCLLLSLVILLFWVTPDCKNNVIKTDEL